MPVRPLPPRPVQVGGSSSSNDPAPNRGNYFPGRGQRLPILPEPEIEVPASRPIKRKRDDQSLSVKIPKTGRFPGQGNKLPPQRDEPRFTPFTGQAQRLPPQGGENNLRANAMQRMRELGHQSEQRRRGREMLDRQADLGRALRRGGARGDVQDLGKRKREYEFATEPTTSDEENG